MKEHNAISVSDLKNRLLEIVRLVEKGKSFQITKGHRPVATLGPIADKNDAVVGFATIRILGSIEDPIPGEWSFDAGNLRSKR